MFLHLFDNNRVMPVVNFCHVVIMSVVNGNHLAIMPIVNTLAPLFVVHTYFYLIIFISTFQMSVLTTMHLPIRTHLPLHSLACQMWST